jgi:hypothetical protein
MSFRSTPTAELSFGDFCQSEIFYDAYLRRDAATLRERKVEGLFVKKQFNRDSLTSYVPVDESHPELKAQEGKDFLLAHGSQFTTAVCLSDDCEIASRLGRADDVDPNGRLFFAPVTAMKEEERPTLTATNWGRMLVEDSVVEVRRAFAVAAEDVVAVGGDEMSRRSLDGGALLRLATWWAAYSNRRGPLVDAVNLKKIAQIGDAHGDETAAEIERVLKDVLALAWRLQGGAVEGGGALYDDNRADLTAVDWPIVRNTLKSELAELDKALSAARGVLG